tara:strand:+ start:130 stop:291 length:162 start_codon:yes stop_codon:yes gene_type:complete
MIARPLSDNPKQNEFYLAFDTAWFSAFYSSKCIWTYNGKEIFPTHWMELPKKP